MQNYIHVSYYNETLLPSYLLVPPNGIVLYCMYVCCELNQLEGFAT